MRFPSTVVAACVRGDGRLISCSNFGMFSQLPLPLILSFLYTHRSFVAAEFCGDSFFSSGAGYFCGGVPTSTCRCCSSCCCQSGSWFCYGRRTQYFGLVIVITLGRRLTWWKLHPKNKNILLWLLLNWDENGINLSGMHVWFLTLGPVCTLSQSLFRDQDHVQANVTTQLIL